MKYLKIIVIAFLLVFLTSCGGEEENYITSAVVNSEGHLVLTYSDGTILDQGLVVPEEIDVDSYLVKFYNIEGNLIDTQLVEHGEDAFEPFLKVPSYIVFDNWDTDLTNITSNLNVLPVYHEKTFTVSFHDTETPITNMLEIEYGQMVTLPAPEIEGKSFLGWYDSDSPYATRLNTYSEIYADMNLYARFEDIVYTVSFHINGDTEIITYQGILGDPLIIPGDPTREDYYFNGWYYDQDEMVPAVNSQIVGDEDIYASWLQFEYTFNDSPAIVGDEYMIITNMIGEHNIVHIPSEIDGYPVGEIGQEAFRFDTFTEVYIPDTVIAIGNYAFAEAPLSSLNIPLSVTHIGDYAFYKAQITDLVLPEGLIDLGDYTFKDCLNLTTVSLPESLADIGINPFLGASNLTTLTLHESNPNFELIDDVLFNESATKLHLYLPYKTNSSYQFPDTVLYFEEYSISGNPYAKILILPDTLLDFNPHYNFYDLNSLNSIQVYDAEGPATIASENGVLYSSDFTILYKYPMGKTETSYRVNSSTIIINNRAFRDNRFITSVILNYGIDTLDDFAFLGCTKLSAINLPPSLRYIEMGVFFDVDGITNISLPDSILSIGFRSFGEMDSLTSLILNEGLTTVKGRILENSNNVTSLHIPSTVTSISHETLLYANGIAIVTIDLGNTTFNVYESSIYSEDYTTLYCVPNGYTQESFTVKEETTSMLSGFGNNPNIKIIHVSSNVTYFYSNVRNLPNLHAVLFYNNSTITTLALTPFDPNEDEGFIIYVRSALYDDYLTDHDWAPYEEFIVPFN